MSIGQVGFHLTSPKVENCFDAHEWSCLQVTAQILGASRLPWEEDDVDSELLQRAGKLRSSVLELLHRDATQRLDVAGFIGACSRVLSVTTQQNAVS